MTSTATGNFEIKGWDEKTYTEIEGERKLTQASVTQAFTGDLVGEGAVEWLMCYRADGTADFVGIQRVVGKLGDKSGSFVVQTTGTFDGTEAKGKWRVSEGLGTGELSDLRGEGEFGAPRGSRASFSLEYDFARAGVGGRERP